MARTNQARPPPVLLRFVLLPDGGALTTFADCSAVALNASAGSYLLLAADGTPIYSYGSVASAGGRGVGASDDGGADFANAGAHKPRGRKKAAA